MVVSPETTRPFRFSVAPDATLSRRLLSSIGYPMLEHLLQFPTLNRIYDQTTGAPSPAEFIDRVLANLKINVPLTPVDLARIPKTGPLVVVANHPFGAIEGLILAHVLLQARPDVRVLANYLLGRIPELRDLMLFVDPFGKPSSISASVAGMRASLDWLRQGGAVLMFPAGAVSHLHLRQQCVTDPPWIASAARIIRKAGAAALPVHFHGRNSNLFQLAGLVHPTLRTMMLPHELINKRRTTVNLRIGRAIPFEKLATFERDEDMTLYLRLRTYCLSPAQPKRPRRLPLTNLVTGKTRQAPIMPAVDAALLTTEVAGLPESDKLLENGELCVYLSEAPRIPHMLQEIGRLREVTFRAAGEGTGNAIDLDAFDQWYRHLFVWHTKQKMLVGAYRVGFTDEILAARGPAGLYTTTLFNIQEQLLRQINPALELGRSFVRAEFQRSHAPLALLWKGLGRIIGRDMRYRHLFGPVSINDEYRDLSQWMMVALLTSHRYLSELAHLIRPKNPPMLRPPRDWDLSGTSRVVRDIDEVSSIVNEIEADEKDVPVLVRQYLKVGAKLLGFNVDPHFGHTLDGLVLVDLRHTDRRLLNFYLTKEVTEQFLQRHSANAGDAAPVSA